MQDTHPQSNGSGPAPAAPAKEKPPLWAWPIALWLLLLPLGALMGVYMLITHGSDGLWDVIRMEETFGAIALALSVLLGVITGLVRLSHR